MKLLAAYCVLLFFVLSLIGTFILAFGWKAFGILVAGVAAILTYVWAINVLHEKGVIP